MRTLGTQLLIVLAAATLAAPLGLLTPPAAQAIDHSEGHPGYCEDDTGVTVVVDFQRLGGTTIVRCNPQRGSAERRRVPDRRGAALGRGFPLPHREPAVRGRGDPDRRRR